MKKDGHKFAWIRRTLEKELCHLLLLSVLRGFQAIILTVISLLLKRLVDAAIGGEWHDLRCFLFLLLLLIGVEVILFTVSKYQGGIFSAKAEMKLRKAAFFSLMHRSYENVTMLHSGDWTGRIVSEARILAQGIQNLVPELVGVVVQLIAAAIAVHVIFPGSAIIVFFGVLFMVFCAAMLRKNLVDLHRHIQIQDSRACGLLQEQISGLAVIRSFSGERQSVKLMGKAFDSVQGARRNWTVFISVCTGGVHAAAQLIFLLGVGACCYRVYQGTMSPGTLTALTSLVQQLSAPLSGLFGVVPSYYAIIASAERLQEIEALPEDKAMVCLSEEDVCRFYKEQLYSFGMREVFFSYDAEHQILQDFQIEVVKGEFLAICGSSGRGKSTILKLLMGLYRTNRGNFYLKCTDGLERKLDESWRSLFAYIPQENGLFSGTIREGICLGVPEIMKDDERIKEALTVACAWEFVSQMEAGLDTELGERGFGLSEGQMQRLAVARALIVGRPVLMLDEATSALDPDTEKRLLKNLKSLEDTTIIAVTHRPAAAELADRVVRL